MYSIRIFATMHMRRSVIILALFALMTPRLMAADPQPPIAGDWTLTFSDDFDGQHLDGSRWRVGQHYAGIAGGGGNDPRQITVAGGIAALRAAQRATSFSGTNYDYACAEISTFQTFRQKYGYFEARMRYDPVKGLWPAFWLMPDRGLYGSKAEYCRSYLKFDFSGLGLTSITSAHLQLTPTAVESGGKHNLLVMQSYDDSWSEADITWNTMPTPDPAFLAQRYNDIVAGAAITVDVTAAVNAQLADDGVLTIVLDDTFMRTKRITFASREASDVDQRPRLVIDGSTYLPVADADVHWSEADSNFGTTATLRVENGWGNTATTYDGGMEVDIMESLGIWGLGQTQHSLHWDGYGDDHQKAPSGRITYPDDGGYHTYGLYWEEGYYAFYIDGTKTHEWTNDRVMSTEAYIICSLQLGGWDNNTIGPQVDGQGLDIDHIRVWSGTRAAIDDAKARRIEAGASRPSVLFEIIDPLGAPTGSHVDNRSIFTDLDWQLSHRLRLLDTDGG